MEAYTTDIKLPYCNVCKEYVKLRGNETAKAAVNRHINGMRHRVRIGPHRRSKVPLDRVTREDVTLPAWLRKGVER